MAQQMFKLVVWLGLGLIVLAWVAAVLSWVGLLPQFLGLPALTSGKQVIGVLGVGLTVACGILWLGHVTAVSTLPAGTARALWATFIAAILGTSAYVYRQALVGARSITRAEITRAQGWDWQYAEKAWRVQSRFEEVAAGEFRFAADMRYVGPRASPNDPPVIARWESTTPIHIPEDAQAVEFDAQIQWTPGAATLYPDMRWEVEKQPRPVRVRLQVAPALEGTALVAYDDRAERWGVMLTPASR